MKKLNYNQMSAHELTARYLDGDRHVNLSMIERQEDKELFENTLNSWSFGKEYLKPVMVIPVFIWLVISR